MKIMGNGDKMKKKSQSLLTSLEGRLDMTMPGVSTKKKDCGCKHKKKMNMGGTVPSANTYQGK
jgi:hypothetical protein